MQNSPLLDLVIYGCTSAGVIAGVQARRMGKSVLLVGPDAHPGGLSSGGLGWTDTGHRATIGGLATEFYHRIWQHYQDPSAWVWQDKNAFASHHVRVDDDDQTMWVFEPHVAENLFKRFMAEQDLEVHYGQWLDREHGVAMAGPRIQSITMHSGQTYHARLFIDATYEGDLMAAAGVDYHVGREANAVYGETWNGVQTGVLHHAHHFGARIVPQPIEPWVIPGDPSSGVLPRISTEHPGEYGQGDKKVQAYCFRLCLTNHPDNRVLFPKPEYYDPAQYELLLRIFQAGWRRTFKKFDPIPNHKTDTNNHGPFSTDNIGFNYDYPEASYERRREIFLEHENYQKGLFYFMANDERVPADVRDEMNQWGLPADEFQDHGNWPHQLYVREARRMIGAFVMTEHEVLGSRVADESVGLGSNTMDSHNVQRYITDEGYVHNEGDLGVAPPHPYEISYRALLPKAHQAGNLLVPGGLSSSHIAFGTIRMEPVFMILGQSAATAACLAIDHNVNLSDLPYRALRDRLVQDGQVLHHEI